MNTALALSQELIGNAQLVLGVIVLVIVLVDLHVSGKLRRALEFPPVPRNTLTGQHLLFVLIAFLLAIQVFAYGLNMLGYRPVPPKNESPPATAPASEPALSSAPSEVGDTGEQEDAAPASQPEDTEDAPSATQPESSPAEETLDEPIRLVGQGLAELVVIGVMLYVAQITFAGGIKGMGLRTDRLGWDLRWAVLAYLAFWPACALVAEASTRLYEYLVGQPPEHQVLQMLEAPELALGWQMVAWTLAGLVAPFFEELLFRGLFLTWLRRVTRSTWLAIVLSGVAFGIIHMPQWHLVPALSLLGILAGYLYARTGSLTLVILMHAVFNMRTLVMMELSR